ncbi:hypothetical protein CONLIGDRAFT_647062 [Coniochaeta ligniaria NRRL 30616]|uniref:Secreted protein n=1 Tax=Coniochaeta ligniaria NRRL 30616 TaxID=1408157 RepID=A0A1J7JH33_9PEZI|nr:hypothetical protein CONLIGDRAFT_647062 [Coniochaeta ligniaria NRRL 30616]
MHFAAILTSIVALLTTNVAADHMMAATRCWGKKCYSDHSVFFVANTTEWWAINANDGCKRTEMVPRMSICIDWAAGRAHYWHGSALRSQKYCLLRDSAPENYLGCDADRCEKSTWTQAECRWNTDAS